MHDHYPIVRTDSVDVSSPSEATWRLLGDLHEAFPSGWVLIGGLMVYLLGVEAGQIPIRVTADADILVRVKLLTTGTVDISRWLLQRGLEFEGANVFEQGHRFSADDVSVDVLVPGNIGSRAERRTVGPNVAIEVVGGPGLLGAGELVPVTVKGGVAVLIPRPRLDAAIVGKAKAAVRLEDPQRHAQDLAFLLGIVDRPTEMAALLTAKDRRVLLAAELILADHEAWSHAGDEPAARAALRILASA